MIKTVCSAATPRQQHKQLQPSASLHVHRLFFFILAVRLQTQINREPSTSVAKPKELSHRCSK